MNDNYGKYEISQTDEEILRTLNAISEISSRMANRIRRAMTIMEGGKAKEPVERTERMCQRAARLSGESY